MKKNLLFVLMYVCATVSAWAETSVSLNSGTLTITTTEAGTLSNQEFTAEQKAATTVVLVGHFNTADLEAIKANGSDFNFTTVDMSGAVFIDATSNSHMIFSSEDARTSYNGNISDQAKSVVGSLYKSEYGKNSYIYQLQVIGGSRHWVLVTSLPDGETAKIPASWVNLNNIINDSGDYYIQDTNYQDVNVGDYIQFEQNNDELGWQPVSSFTEGESHDLGGRIYASSDDMVDPASAGLYAVVGGSEKSYNNGSWGDVTEVYDYSQMKFTYWKNSITKAITSNYVPGTTVITQSAFTGCTLLQEAVFNSGIIGSKVLGDNETDHPSIQRVTIGSGITELQEFAFYKTQSSFDWSNATSLTTIGKSAFFECPGITGVMTIPNSVQTIGEKAFEACNGIQAIVISQDSHLTSIGSRAFWMSENEDTRNLKNVFVMKEDEINCALDAFDFTSTYGQTGVGRVTTRLWYPPAYYEYYVGSYKKKYTTGKQSDINAMQGEASNGWQKFISSGIPTQGKDYWRTYCDIVPLKVPAGFAEGAPVNFTGTNVYLVYGYDNTTNNALLVKMKEGDVIPAWTGVVIHYHVETDQSSVIYFEKYSGEGYTGRYDAQYYEDPTKAQYHVTDSLYKGQYKNYLRALNTYGYKQHIDNVEKVGGVKTYRNFFFGNGEIINAAGSVVLNENGDYVSGAKGKDWDDYYSNTYTGWGFFRAVSGNYNISSKAYLHYPVADRFPGATSALMNNDLSQVVSEAKSCGFIITYLDDEIGQMQQGITTEIESVNDSEREGDSIYTLQGVKVKTPNIGGIYIKNGKKYIVK